jgi:hypothetical protein
VAFKFLCSAGNATFTTVLSINAILEARVVATSTQRPAGFEQGARAGRERITVSSHGSWRTGDIFPIQSSDVGDVTVEPANLKAIFNEAISVRNCALDKLRRFFSD